MGASRITNDVLLGNPLGTPAVVVPDRSGGYGVGVGGDVSVRVTRDGTPTRVATLLLASGAVLAALKILGFRFNVGVSG